MSDEHPEFTLPDWGTDGAPPEPATDTSVADGGEDRELEIRVERQTLVTTTALPSRWTVQSIHGLVATSGRSKDTDPERAQAKAVAKALEALEGEAAELGADAVVGVRLAVTRNKGVVVATAYGTAVGVSG